MKKYFNPFRLVTYLLVLYAAGHTYGALVATPRFGEGADTVLSAMRSTHFVANGSECTWLGFYLGFGYQVSIFFLFAAFVAWFLGGLTPRDQRAWVAVSWALFASFVGSTYLAIHYFFLPPVIFASLITGLLGVQCIRLSRPLAETSAE
jgi:hypothetical protein